MSRRRFNKCLNKELKAFNCSIGSLIGSSFGFVLVGVSKGLMWGFGFGAIGFIFGKWLSREWFLGGLQKRLYWNLPFSKIWIDKNIPPSYVRYLM